MDMKWLNGFMMQGECGGGGTHISFWRMKDKQIVRVRIGVTVTEPHAKINSSSAALCNGFARVICHPTWNANSRGGYGDTLHWHLPSPKDVLASAPICLHNCCPARWSTAQTKNTCADAHECIWVIISLLFIITLTSVYSGNYKQKDNRYIYIHKCDCNKKRKNKMSWA